MIVEELVTELRKYSRALAKAEQLARRIVDLSPEELRVLSLVLDASEPVIRSWAEETLRKEPNA